MVIREYILCTRHQLNSRQAFDVLPRESDTGQTAYLEGDRKQKRASIMTTRFQKGECTQEIVMSFHARKKKVTHSYS